MLTYYWLLYTGCPSIEDVMQFDLGSMDWSTTDEDRFAYHLQPHLDNLAAIRPLDTANVTRPVSLSSANSAIAGPDTTYVDSIAVAAHLDACGSQTTSQQGDTSGWMTPNYDSSSAAVPWLLQPTHLSYGSRQRSQSVLSKDHKSSSLRASLMDASTPHRHSHHQSASGVNTRLSRHDLWVRKLSEINIKLYQHAANISSRGSDTASSRSPSYRPYTDNDTDYIFLSNRVMGVDQTFNITMELLEILNNQHTSGIEHDSLQGSGAESPDHGTLLLMFSSYLRLLDIYSTIFRRLHTCLGLLPPRPSTSSSAHHHPSPVYNSDSLSSAQLPRFPTLRIGDFSLQNPSSLHALLVIQLAEQLLQNTYVAMQHLNRRRRQRDSAVESSPPLPPRERYDAFYGVAEDGNADDVSEVLLKSVQKRQGEAMSILRELKRALNSR